MVFLNPWFLLGLAAAAIPVLIHLLHVRKLRTVEFSSLRFLKELQRSRLRALRIRQLLLLLLRTLLIVALVLAFARPTIRGSLFGIGGGSASRTTVILLDDSPSMVVRDERGVRFEQARQAARRVAGMAAEGDRVLFTTVSQAIMGAPSAAPSMEAVVRAIDGAAATAIHTPFAGALERVRPVLQERPGDEREIFLVTDAQASQFQPSRRTSNEQADPLLRATVIQVGTGAPENTCVAGIDLESQVLGPGKPLRLSVTLFHVGKSARTDAFLSLYLDGTRVAQRSVDLPAGRPVQVPLEVVPKRTGVIPGYVEIEDDVFPADNIRHFALRIPAHIRILAVGESPADLEYPLLALTLRGDTAFGGMFRVTSGSRSRLQTFDARSTDVLLLSGLRSLTAGEASAVGRFLQTGGGVMLFAPPDPDVASYRDVLLPAMGLPREMRNPPPARDTSAQDGRFVTFSSFDRDHPILRDMLDRTQRGRSEQIPMESPRIRRTFAPTAGGSGQIVIGLSNGVPFLSDFPAGGGRLLWFSVDAGTRSSDLPLRGIFAPLLHRSVLYAAGSFGGDRTARAGEPVVLTPPEGTGQDPSRLMVRSPSGLEEQFVHEPAGPRRSAAVRTGPALETGIYELHARAAAGPQMLPLDLAAVAVDTAESVLRPAGDDELGRFWEDAGISPDHAKRIPADADLETSILEARSGTELWRLFAGLALLCALLEMFVARVSRGEVPDA